ncbi:MAG: hypothetical protein KDA20_01170 [Phycisphaerales bacterium]|nr:hypothetical protein [Phycisphaerales bacterium]
MENKMKSFVCAAAMLALAGAASAGNFSIGAIDAGNGTFAGSRPGTGIDITGGTIYQDSFGTPGATGEPNAAFIPLAPSLEFDSYLTIDSGPVTASYAGGDVAAVGPVPGTIGFSASDFRGGWFLSGNFVPAFAVSDKPNVSYELFVGRITHTGTLSGKLSVAIAEENSAGFKTIEGDIVTDPQAGGLITHDVNGNRLVKNILDPNSGYAWVAKEFQQVVGSTTYTVTDLYLQNVTLVPTPGALGLLGVAGLGAIRRRR